MAKAKEYAHLVKSMIVQQAPTGLYAEPRVWMESKDLEGFNAHFSYGFIKEPCVCHPLEGSLVHPYDELLVFVGYQNGDILQLGADVSVGRATTLKLMCSTVVPSSLLASSVTMSTPSVSGAV